MSYWVFIAKGDPEASLAVHPLLPGELQPFHSEASAKERYII